MRTEWRGALRGDSYAASHGRNEAPHPVRRLRRTHPALRPRARRRPGGVAVPAKIVFTGGAEIVVDDDASQARDRLAADKHVRHEPYTKFLSSGTDVYIASEQVAFIVQHGHEAP